MKIWIVNPFDPLPGDGEQPARYSYLCEALQARGHDVTWWSSSFSHRFKRRVHADIVAREAAASGFHIRLVPTSPYEHNVSLRRVWNHRQFALRFQQLATREPRPELILASSPPLESAWICARLGRRWQIPMVIDTQDQWPDTLVRGLPKALGRVRQVVLAPWYALERKTYRAATALTAVADGYLQRARSLCGVDKRAARFFIGVDLESLDRNGGNGTAQEERPGGGARTRSDEIRLIYAGSLTSSYGVPTIIQAAKICQRQLNAPLRFIITGTGELEADLGHAIAKEGLTNITVTGFIPYDQWLGHMKSAHIAFNTALPEAYIRMPKKLFSYCGCGLAVLNTLGGECAELIGAYECGKNYAQGDVRSCFEAVAGLVSRPQLLAQMRHSSRQVANALFNRRRIYADFAEFLECTAR